MPSCAWADGQRPHAAYAEAARLAPTLPRVHINRGLAFHDDGRLAAAEECFRRALALDPEAPDAWRCPARRPPRGRGPRRGHRLRDEAD